MVVAPDLSPLRARFPSLQRTGPDGRPVVWADAPGGSQMPDTVLEAMVEYLTTSNANTHGVFAASEETGALIAEARRAAADLTGADAGEIAFGANATTLLFHLSRSFGRTLAAGDEIVVTRLDHDANIRPWVRAAEDAGAAVRWVNVDPADATLDMQSFEAALSDRTRLVACTLASNAVGSIPAASAVSVLAHEVGALVAFDGVHLAQHRALSAHKLGADLLACSPYKFFGPHMGVLAVRRELLDTWTPYKLRPSPDETPDRWETGTLNHEGLAGLVAAVDYLAGIGVEFGNAMRPDTRRAKIVQGFEAIAAYEQALTVRFLEGLSTLPHVRLFGISDPGAAPRRTPTFAIRVNGQDPVDTCRLLGERGIFTWDGHYYAIELMEALGVGDGGAVRIGFCHYSTAAEVDRVLTELASLA